MRQKYRLKVESTRNRKRSGIGAHPSGTIGRTLDSLDPLPDTLRQSQGARKEVVKIGQGVPRAPSKHPPPPPGGPATPNHVTQRVERMPENIPAVAHAVGAEEDDRDHHQVEGNERADDALNPPEGGIVLQRALASPQR